jgi:hypothetical protein
MGHKHLSATDFDIMIGDTLVHVESMSASITDNRQAVMTRGVPTGYVDGDVACSGEIEIDSKNFNLITDVARAAGSFRDMPTFDIIYKGKNISEELKVELFDCLLNITDLLSNDGKGGEKQRHKLAFQVTGAEFVRINGVPYLSDNNIRDF